MYDKRSHQDRKISTNFNREDRWKMSNAWKPIIIQLQQKENNTPREMAKQLGKTLQQITTNADARKEELIKSIDYKRNAQQQLIACE